MGSMLGAVNGLQWSGEATFPHVREAGTRGLIEYRLVHRADVLRKGKDECALTSGLTREGAAAHDLDWGVIGKRLDELGRAQGIGEGFQLFFSVRE